MLRDKIAAAGRVVRLTLFLTKSAGWFVLSSFSRKYSLMDLDTTATCSLPSPARYSLSEAIPHIVIA